MSVLDPETVDQLRTLARDADSDLLHRLQASFARDTPPRLVALRAALVAGNADAVAFGLHTLSGNAANLGASEIVATLPASSKAGSEATTLARIARMPSSSSAIRTRMRASVSTLSEPSRDTSKKDDLQTAPARYPRRQTRQRSKYGR